MSETNTSTLFKFFTGTHEKCLHSLSWGGSRLIKTRKGKERKRAQNTNSASWKSRPWSITNSDGEWKIHPFRIRTQSQGIRGGTRLALAWIWEAVDSQISSETPLLSLTSIWHRKGSICLPFCGHSKSRKSYRGACQVTSPWRWIDGVVWLPGTAFLLYPNLNHYSLWHNENWDLTSQEMVANF